MMVTVGLVVLTIIGIFLWRFTGPQPSQQTAGQISATSPVTAEPRPAQEAQPTSGSEQPSTPEQAAPEKQPTPQGSAPTSGAASAPSPIPAVRGQIGGSSGAVIKRVIPDVLPSASETIRGTVVVTVRLHVDQAGNVALAEFEDEGPSKYFSRLSLEAARQWKFAPPLISGQLAPSIWTLSFQFTRERTDVIPVQTAP
jgi:TonB family protein